MAGSLLSRVQPLAITVAFHARQVAILNTLLPANLNTLLSQEALQQIVTEITILGRRVIA